MSDPDGNPETHLEPGRVYESFRQLAELEERHLADILGSTNDLFGLTPDTDGNIHGADEPEGDEELKLKKPKEMGHSLRRLGRILFTRN
jgi:hypothetical protein